jgi:hypothetical protein
MRVLGALLAALTLVTGLTAAPAAAERNPEPPPPQGTRLHFEKRLMIQETPVGKVFAETRRVAEGENLAQILSKDYKIPPSAIPLFVEAFRALNPTADPNRLNPGRIVWAPFKVVEHPAGPSQAAPAPVIYTIRAGEHLWKILQLRFGIPNEKMSEALAAVAEANPEIENLDHVLIGQRIVIPATVFASAREVPAPVEATPAPPDRTVLDLLRDLGCRVEDTGEMYLPLSRGHTVRLEGRAFPVVRGPLGGTVILDPESRLSTSLARAVREAWGYEVVAGSADLDTQLDLLLGQLRFHELSSAPKRILLGRGAELIALARWTIVPRPEDLWEGRIHLLFSTGARIDPSLVQMVRRAGFAVHALGPPADAPAEAALQPALAEIPMGDFTTESARLLKLLGVAYRVRPEMESELGDGVRYRVTPELVFQHDGLDYAVVSPRAARRVESVLSRAGFLTLAWPDEVSPLARLGDLLRLLDVPHTQTTAEFPQGQAIRLRVTGIVLQEPRLASVLYPHEASMVNPVARLFLTDARLPPEAARGLVELGLLPWLVTGR